MKKHSHYYKDVSHLNEIDVYRVLDLFQVVHPCVQHAVKKLLCSGMRGVKDKNKDIQEAIDSLLRFQEMYNEEPMLYEEILKKTEPEITLDQKVKAAKILDLEQQLGRSENAANEHAHIRAETSYPITPMAEFVKQNSLERAAFYSTRELKI